MIRILFAALTILCLQDLLVDATPINEEPTDVESYRIHVSDSGEQFNEEVEVDEDKQTELFRVPAHGNVAKSNIMFDFKMNYTMVHFPLESVCYLLPLTRTQPTPKSLVRNLHMATNDDVVTTKETLMIDKEITDRTFLSGSLVSLCAKSRMFHVKQLPVNTFNVEDITKSMTGRTRRAIPKLCKDSLNLKEIANVCPPFTQHKTRCKVEIQSCSWFVDCPGYGGAFFIARNKAESYILAWSGESKCVKAHRQWGFVCCGHYCS